MSMLSNGNGLPAVKAAFRFGLAAAAEAAGANNPLADPFPEPAPESDVLGALCSRCDFTSDSATTEAAVAAVTRRAPREGAAEAPEEGGNSRLALAGADLAAVNQWSM